MYSPTGIIVRGFPAGTCLKTGRRRWRMWSRKTRRTFTEPITTTIIPATTITTTINITMGTANHMSGKMISRSTVNAIGSTGKLSICHQGHSTQIRILYTIITTTTITERGTGTETETGKDIEKKTETGTGTERETEIEKDTRTEKETDIGIEVETERQMQDNGTEIPIYTSHVGFYHGVVHG